MIDAYRRQTHAIATLTPSGNVVVERVTSAILRDFPQVSGHFTRIRVVGSTDAYADDYDWEGMLSAAELLGHAKPDVICWNGSKGGSIGIDKDYALVAQIKEATGIPSMTSTIAILDAFRARGVTRFGMVTPFADAYVRKIPPHFAAQGFNCVAEAHAGLTDNLSYASLEDAAMLDMARSVAAARPQALILYCTNLPGAHLAPVLEAELGIPVFNSTSICVAACLRLIGVDPAPGRAWGSAFG